MRSLTIVFLLVLVAGCSGNTPTYTKASLNENQLVLVDARHRAITARVGRTADSSTGTQNMPIVCTEASPDTLVVEGESIDAGLRTLRGLSAFFNRNTARTGAAFGLRTNTVQILRDSLFHLCQAFANGAITGIHYIRSVERLQNVMIALLAADQLTGYAQPTVIRIDAAGSVSADRDGASGHSLSDVQVYRELYELREVAIKEQTDATAALDLAKNKVSEAQIKAAAAEAELKAKPNDDALKSKLQTARAELQKAQNEVKTAEEQQKRRTEHRNVLESALDRFQRQSGRTLETSGVAAIPSVAPRGQSWDAIANAIVDIVKVGTRGQGLEEACVDALMALTFVPQQYQMSDVFLKVCEKYFDRRQ